MNDLLKNALAGRKKMVDATSSAFAMELSVYSHTGYFVNDDDNHPRNLLNDDYDASYMSANLSSDEVIFEISKFSNF